MATLTAGSSVTVPLGDYDSVTISTRGSVAASAVSGLGVAVGPLGEFTGTRTLGPYTAGSLLLTASGSDCQYEIADGARNLGTPQLANDGAGNIAGIADPLGRIYHGTKTGVAAVQRIVAGANPSSGTGAGTGNGFIIDTQRTAQGAFFGVRLVFANYDTTAPMTINRAAAAVTSYVAQTSGQYSGGAAGNTLTWTAVTFNGGSATASVPTAVAGVGSTSNGIHIQPGIVISDFIPLISVARADGSALPMIRTRVHLSDNAFPPNLAQPSVQSLNTLANAGLTGGHLLLSGSAADTAANLLTNTLTPYYFGGVVEPVGIIFYGGQQARTLAAFGDSLTQGVQSTGYINGWPSRLNAKYGALSSSLAVNAANWGVAGQRLENSLAICRAYCAQHKPHYASIYAWSPNNIDSSPPYMPIQSIMDSLWAQVLYTIDYLQQLGVTPVVLTSAPVNGYTAAAVALVRAQNARVMALPSSVVKVDTATALTDPTTANTSTPTINPIYSGGDGIHYNDAGYALKADMVYAAIK